MNTNDFENALVRTRTPDDLKQIIDALKVLITLLPYEIVSTIYLESIMSSTRTAQGRLKHDKS